MNAREPFLLGEWTVDPQTGTLSGPAGQRRLTPKLVDLLVALARRAGQVATRDELLREVWGERSAVSDEPLTRAVAELRRNLGDERGDPAYIETIPKRGYRVVAAVTPVAAAPVPATPQPLATPPAAAAPAAAASPAFNAPGRAAVHPQPVAAAEVIEALPPPAAPARPRAEVLAIGAAAAAVLTIAAVLVGVAFYGSRGSERAAPIGVAVLPFADLSAAADHQYFADGVHEEIVARLAGIPGLRVAPRSAVRPYLETDLPRREVARQLGVGAVLEGSVRHAEGRVRVTAELIDSATDSHLWAETFDKPLTLANLFDIQEEIAVQVTAGLTRSLAVGDPARDAPLPTASLAAYEAFLLGKYHYRRRQPGDVKIAVDRLQAAVAADPNFADAWDWLAYAWNDAGLERGWTTPSEAYPRARAAALRALELDPKLATSSALLGFLRAVYDWDWQPALVELERAVAAAPHESGTVWSYAYVLSLLGRHDEAVELVANLAAGFPEQGRLALEVAERLVDAGRFAAARDAANTALAGGGVEGGQVRELLGVAAFGLGELDVAIAELERAAALQQRASQVLGHLAAVYAHVGRTADARALITEIDSRFDQSNLVVLARVYTALDERDRAIALLERAADERQRDVLDIGNDPFFAPLRGDARFAKVIVRTGLEPPAAEPSSN